MIHKVTIENFKRFKQRTEFDLHPDGVTFLAGGNNSGKSTLLQALAVWEFARLVVEISKGKIALLPQGKKAEGIGISAEEFSPIALPNLKHLWSGLRVCRSNAGDGYSLRIRCDWNLSGETGPAKYLEMGLALANDRLFIKCVDSNLTEPDTIPRLAYLPPFAGITPREDRMTEAQRKRWIGRGLAGAVLRNSLYDFWSKNFAEREKLKGTRGRISKVDLATLRRTDAWERLKLALEEVFKTGVSLSKFDDLYHLAINVRIWDGQLQRKQFKKHKGETERDLMVEGSGYLQWLSVYSLAVNPEINVLLLDEPDAHLHPALQGHLIHKLGQLARENRKQVLLATHSTTILLETGVQSIFRMEDRAYLTDERGRVGLFVGLGSQYAPRLDQLKRSKRLFLHDGPSDLEILQAWAKTLGIAWPDNLVCWKYTKDREAREILFDELRAEIPGLKAISLQDRDDYPFTQTKNDLTFDDLPPFNAKGLGLRRWRRRNIENHLLHPGAIARASGKLENEIHKFLQDVHGINITQDFIASECPQTLANTNGKEIITKNARSITLEFGSNYKAVAEVMKAEEIPEDPKTLLKQIMELCQP